MAPTRLAKVKDLRCFPSRSPGLTGEPEQLPSGSSLSDGGGGSLSRHRHRRIFPTPTRSQRSSTLFVSLMSPLTTKQSPFHYFILTHLPPPHLGQRLHEGKDLSYLAPLFPQFLRQCLLLVALDKYVPCELSTREALLPEACMGDKAGPDIPVVHEHLPKAPGSWPRGSCAHTLYAVSFFSFSFPFLFSSFLSS